MSTSRDPNALVGFSTCKYPAEIVHLCNDVYFAAATFEVFFYTLLEFLMEHFEEMIANVSRLIWNIHVGLKSYINLWR